MKFRKKASAISVRISTLSLCQGIIIFDIYENNAYCGQCILKENTERRIFVLESQCDEKKISKKTNEILAQLIEKDMI